MLIFEITRPAIGKKTTMNNVSFALISNNELEEIVVTGYGTQKKVNLTGAVAAVTGEVLQDRPIVNVGEGLQGVTTLFASCLADVSSSEYVCIWSYLSTIVISTPSSHESNDFRLQHSSYGFTNLHIFSLHLRSADLNR